MVAHIMATRDKITAIRGKALAPLARMIGLGATLVTVFVVAGIVLVAFHANPANGVAHHVTSWSSTLTSPFHGMFHPRGRRETIEVNWGVAAAVYFVAGHLLRRVLARFSPASE